MLGFSENKCLIEMLILKYISTNLKYFKLWLYENIIYNYTIALHVTIKMWTGVSKPNENKITCMIMLTKIVHYNEL